MERQETYRMDEAPLEVEVVGGRESASIVATGELDLAGVSVLEAALDWADETDVQELVLDLRGVTFIDSSGIRCVLDAHHRTLARGGALRIRAGLEAGVVFGLAGLTGRLPFVA